MTAPPPGPAGSPAWARSRISASPLSIATGCAPARQSLMPLYSAGLWLAVNIAPGASRWPLAKYSPSVDARPMSRRPRHAR
jgi:hypothetical protein